MVGILSNNSTCWFHKFRFRRFVDVNSSQPPDRSIVVSSNQHLFFYNTFGFFDRKVPQPEDLTDLDISVDSNLVIHVLRSKSVIGNQTRTVIGMALADEGVEALCTALPSTNLAILDIKENNITAHGAKVPGIS